MLRAQRARRAAPSGARRRSRCSRPTGARRVWTRRGPARADRVRVDRARPRRSTRRRSSASCAARSAPGVARADLRRLVILNAKALVERDSDFSRVRRADPAQLRLRGDARLGHRARRDRRAARRAPARAAADARARRRDRADRPAAARLRRRARSPPRSTRPSDLDFDFLGLQTLYDRYLICDKTGAEPVRIEAPQLFWMRVAMGVCLAEDGDDREARVLDLYARVQGAALLLLDADAVQRGHAASAALLLLPLLHRGHAAADRRPRHRRERDVLEVGGRPRRLVDRGARHRRAHRVDQRREPGRRAVPEDAQRPARRRQPGRQARRARAAPTSRSGTTTSASSSSCAATPATSAGARTT